MGRQDALNVVRAALKMMTESKGFGRVMEKVNVTSAGDGHCQAEFTVDEDMTNLGGTLHGGCTATIVDIVSTVGLLTFKESSTPGVSVNLSVNYLKGARVGETIIVDSKAVKVGKTLAFLDVQLKTKEKNAVVATASHVKYVGG